MNPPQDNRRPDESLDIAEQIDQICDAFEESCSREETPRIEDFLERGMGLPRDRLLVELLLIDREYRINRGDVADRGIYLQRFPDYSTVIEGLDFATIVERNGRARAHLSILPSLEPGTTIGGFELVKQLGLGAAGTVWLARDARLRRLIALKTPRQEFLCDNVRERFLREGQTSAQLRHPNIVAVYDVGEDRGRAFIVAEFIDGVSLRQRLDNGRPRPREAAELTAMLAEALHHAHEQGVVHRDLKPANIVLDRDGQPHITDFGLAKWAEDSCGITLDGQLLGTPAYMSPEQARGDAARVDRRADVFALGVILYETLAGRPPFEGEPAAVIDAIIRQEPHRPRSIDRLIARDLETICLKAMEKEVERRYATTQEMAVDLRRFLRGEAILARRAGAVRQTWRWLRLRPALSAALLLGLISGMSVVIAAQFARENRQLQGLQTVTLATEPSGAEVIFVRQSDSNGELMPSHVVRAGTSPVRQELPPGSYLVVAVLDGKDVKKRRFQEALRLVPRVSDDQALVYLHLSWKKGPNGEIELPKIRIPPREVTEDMAFMDAEEGSPNVETDRRAQQPAPFFMDITEWNYKQFTEVINEGRPTASMIRRPRSELTPKLVNFDQAVFYAELMGKRLPTEAEYHAAICYMKRVQENPLKQLDQSNDVSRLAKSADDIARRKLDGLSSSPPEWTTGWALAAELPAGLSVVDDFMPVRRYRVVWTGKDVDAGSLSTEANHAGRRRVENRMTSTKGIGFRCVRSAAPPFYD